MSSQALGNAARILVGGIPPFRQFHAQCIAEFTNLALQRSTSCGSAAARRRSAPARRAVRVAAVGGGSDLTCAGDLAGQGVQDLPNC